VQTIQLGDRVQVHYVKRSPDGAVRSSRARGDGPLSVTVGTPHPRLHGLGAELVGLALGSSVTVVVPAEKAYGLADPGRVRRVSRDRFGENQAVIPGSRVRLRMKSGRIRSVRVVEVRGRSVTIDANHPRCGQSVELEVEILSVGAAESEIGFWRL
jgi:FKBP-type peptidyl-prolyl cis-trans isomerase 2